ncbi:hemerythrin domain-containing protein [Cellvibrio sp.]|uniref:hemerythrin domain-containing protein n=1 Tax=Cellvibrio sp. TaxID=1965322 RepID=UPI00396473B2
MMMLVSAPLADVVNAYPETSAVLTHFNVVVGQTSSLATALNFSDVSRSDCLDQLRQALSDSACKSYRTASVGKLVDAIVKRFHEPHRAQMPGLINDARYIEKRFAQHPACPQGLTALLIAFFDDLIGHMDQEELFLFPALAAAESFTMFSQLAIAHHSHDRHLNFLNSLREKTNNFKAPNDASAAWHGLYERLLEFYLQLNIHIAIENHFLLES